MKNNSSILARIATITGLALGAFALSVFATGSTWHAPTCSPPDCNADAPINVGSTSQSKAWPGGLTLATLLATDGLQIGSLASPGSPASLGSFVYVDGNQQAGYVLSTDGNGNASWVSTSSLGIGSGNVSNNYYLNKEIFDTATWHDISIGQPMQYETAPHAWTVPADVTSIRISAWGAGGGGAFGGSGNPGLASAGSFGSIVRDVTPGDTIYIHIAAGGKPGNMFQGNCGSQNADGNGNSEVSYRTGKSGVGSTYVKIGTSPTNAIVKGAGGGGGYSCSPNNGAVGGQSGQTAGGYTYGSGGSSGSYGQVGAVLIEY